MNDDGEATPDCPLPDIPRVAGILLVDRMGQVLLQLRDRNAPTHPGMWSIPGGHIESDEDPVAAARREVMEETGLTVPEMLPLFQHEVVPRDPPMPGMIERFIYYAPTTATQDKVVCGEGDAMVFLAPDAIAELNMVASAQRIVKAFLASPEYAALHRISI